MNLLLESAVDVAVVLLLALIAMPLLRRQSAALRHLVLSAALSSAAVLPFIAPWLPEWRVPVPLPPIPILSVAATINPGALAVENTAASHQAAANAVNPWTLARVVWAAGAVIALGALAFGFVRLLRLSRSARTIDDARWASEADAIRRELGLKRAVTLLESSDPSLLVVWGVRRPRILLPRAAREWPIARMRIVLYHELSHIQRGDWIVQCLGELMRALYWFNPLTWAVCARLRHESDHAADDAVLSRGIDGPDYASHLVEIAHVLRQRRVWAPAPAMAHTSGFERRVQAMLNEQINRRPLSTFAMATTVALCLAVAVPIVVASAAQALASFTGQIVDEQNGVLPGTVVTLTNMQTNVQYRVTTNREGRYEIPGLPSGSYVMESELPGFRSIKWEFTVSGQNIDREFKMELGRLQETITIAAGPERGAGSGLSAPRKDPTQDARIEAYKKKLADQEAACQARAANPPTTGPKIGGNIRTPSKLRDVRPVYPADLASAGVAGKVVLDATIGPDGDVVETTVVSTTNEAFAASLVEAVRQWQFSSTMLNCVKMGVKMTVTGNFEYRP